MEAENGYMTMSRAYKLLMMILRTKPLTPTLRSFCSIKIPQGISTY